MRFSSHGTSVAVAIAIIAACVATGRIIHGLLRARFVRLAEESRFPLGNVLAWSLRHSLPFWFLLGGIYVASLIIRLGPGVRTVVNRLLVSSLVVSLTVWLANLGSRLLRLRASLGGQPSSATGVVRNALKIAVYLVGGLLFLRLYGISIKPLLTTVGLGGLAVALGLRETVANLIAGMQLAVAGTLRVGDFIRIENGEEGSIQDILWRETRVLTLANTVVVIPNSRLVETVVTNYDLPSKPFELSVPMIIHHASDLEFVEHLTVAVARTVMRNTPGGVREAEPILRFAELSEVGVRFQVLLRVRDAPSRALVRHEFIKSIARAYDLHGIVVPGPFRASFLQPEPIAPAPGLSTPTPGARPDGR